MGREAWLCVRHRDRLGPGRVFSLQSHKRDQGVSQLASLHVRTQEKELTHKAQSAFGPLYSYRRCFWAFLQELQESAYLQTHYVHRGA